MTHSVVVGGAGFVGSWVVDEILKDSNAKVTIIDNLISSEKWNISTDPRVNFIEGSASEMSTYDKLHGPIDFVFQLACFHGNQSSIARPLDDLENGLKTTLVTLEWIRNNSPDSRIIYAGAGCALAEKTWENPTPARELDYTSLIHDSPYSITKITGEMYCIFYTNHFNLDTRRVRFQNIYGPREILGAGIWRGTENTIWRNVIPTFIYKAITNQDIQLYGNIDASRDFTYVRDVASAVVNVAKRGKKGDVYNIASGKETFISDLAKLIIENTGSRSKILKSDKRNWDNSGRRVGDNTKIFSDLGFHCSTDLEKGLKETIAWTNSNIDLINQSISKFRIN